MGARRIAMVLACGVIATACASPQTITPSAPVCAALGRQLVHVANPLSVTFLPFGAGQVQNGDTAKGIAFASSQALTGATSAGIFLYLSARYGTQANVPVDDAVRVRTLQQVEIATGVAFFALYAWSVIDAMRNHRRFVPRCSSTLATP